VVVLDVLILVSVDGIVVLFSVYLAVVALVGVVEVLFRFIELDKKNLISTQSKKNYISR
jgi:hypothetical protein